MIYAQKQAIREFEEAWARYRAFTKGLLDRDSPLTEVDFARLSAAVKEILSAREKLDRQLGLPPD